jgi:imidazoleglycerol-phosphate dehydratase
MRQAHIERRTTETRIAARLDLDGTGASEIATGVGFLDHMLTLFARHALVDLSLKAEGDLAVDDHHTVEDAGLVMGQLVARALGERAGIRRYGHACVPMDEALADVAIDISGRPMLVYEAAFPAERIGTFATELVREWFQAFASEARLTLHVEVVRGLNSHHVAEACFKALARAFREAVEIDARQAGRIPSTKGSLTG